MKTPLDTTWIYEQLKYGLPEEQRGEFRAKLDRAIDSMRWDARKSAHSVNIRCQLTIGGELAECISKIGAECDGETLRLILWRMYRDVARLLRDKISVA